MVTAYDTIWCSTVALPANNLAALGHPRICSFGLSRAMLMRSAHKFHYKFFFFGHLIFGYINLSFGNLW